MVLRMIADRLVEMTLGGVWLQASELTEYVAHELQFGIGILTLMTELELVGTAQFEAPGLLLHESDYR